MKSQGWFDIIFLPAIVSSVAAEPQWDSRLSQGVAVNTITNDIKGMEESLFIAA